MKMLAPEFWSEKGILPALLNPVGSLYYAASKQHYAGITPEAIDIPVICVGWWSGKNTSSTGVSRYIGGNGKKCALH
jgi:tetraacyldisaccharide-1-P 4'-kinase